MFAVIEVSGKQFIVKEKDIIEVMKLGDDLQKDQEITIDHVLCMFESDGSVCELGKPYLEGKKVVVKVLEPFYKGEKIVGAKFKQRKRYTRTFGHRDQLTKLEIQTIA